METVLFIIIITLLVVIIGLIYTLGKMHQTVDYYHKQWTTWERRWYEAQGIVSDKLGYHISPSGLNTEIKLKKHKEK